MEVITERYDDSIGIYSLPARAVQPFIDYMLASHLGLIGVVKEASWQPYTVEQVDGEWLDDQENELKRSIQEWQEAGDSPGLVEHKPKALKELTTRHALLCTLRSVLLSTPEVNVV